MSTRGRFDDTITEAMLRGRSPAGPPELAELAAFVEEVRAVAASPAPSPSPALAAILDGKLGLGPADVPRPPTLRRRTMRRRVARIGIGLGVAAGGLVGAAAAGALPGPVADAVDAVTPLRLGRAGHPEHPEHPDNRGRTVSDDARDRGKDQGGPRGGGGTDADGAEPAEGPPPSWAGQHDTTGLDRANETPAAPHAPDSVPPRRDPNEPHEPHGPPSSIPASDHARPHQRG